MKQDERTLDVERLLAQSDWARGLALRLVGDAQLADDVVQEAWVAALERPPEGARLREWFARVVRNLALRRRRREAARGDVERRAARREGAPGADAALARLDEQRRLAEAVLALEEPCRTALVLRHVEGLSAREIAARTGCSEEAARQRVARALARLRARLGARGLGALAAVWCGAHDAQAWPAVWTGAGTIGGTLVGTKTVLATAAACAALGGAWWFTREDSRAVRPVAAGTPRAEAPLEVVAGGRIPDAVAAPPAGAERGVVDLRDATDVAGALRGRCVDDRGVPLAQVEVLLLAPEGDDVLAASRSDDSGAFELPAGAAADGMPRLKAQCDGHVPAEAHGAGPDLGDLVLVRRPRLSGVLRTPEGVPASPPGRVELSVLEATGESRWTQVPIDAQGRFVADELTPGRLVAARGLARSWAPCERRPELELAPGSVHELELELAVGEVVRGVVIDGASQRPVPFAEVWSESWVYDADSIEPSTVADVEGRFELRGVRANVVRNDADISDIVWVSVTARAEGFLGRPFEPTTLRRGPDGELGMLLIRITRADASVGGRITWPDGAPAADVPIYTVDEGMNLHFAQSDAKGRFTLEGLPPGILALCARTNPEQQEGPHGRADARIELVGGERAGCELVLAFPAERIAGRVVDAHGAGLAGIALEAGEHFCTGGLTMGVGHHRTVSDDDGHFVFERLAPGRYQIEIAAAQRREHAARPAQHSLDLAAGERRDDVVFEFVPAISFFGWIDVGAQDATTFEVLRLRAADGEELERTAVGADGRFRFEGCWPEACTLVLSGHGRELARVEVGPAGAQGVVLAAPR